MLVPKPELFEQAQRALADETARDATFRARLSDAAERFVEMRRRAPPRPIVDPVALAAALEDCGARALEDELARRAR